MQPLQRHQNNFDLIRLIGVLLTVWMHSFTIMKTNGEDPLKAITGQDGGFWGVAILFSISGFLIHKSLASSKNIWHYLWKRILRIQPLLILIVLLSIFVLGVLYTNMSLSEYFFNSKTWRYLINCFPIISVRYDLPGVFTLLPHSNIVNGSLWTLLVEERLYVLLSVISLLPKKEKWILWLTLPLAALYMLHQYVPVHAVLGRYDVPFVIMFLVGSCYYYYVDVIAKVANEKWVTWITIITLLAGFALNMNWSLWAILFPSVILLLALKNSKLNAFSKIGDLSYFTYLAAFPLQQMLSPYCSSAYTLFFTSAVILLPIAYFSWHYFEKPIKEKLSK